MDLKSKTERLDARRPCDMARAAQLLRLGGTVAFPTETVYGLGANALDSGAVAAIFTAKQRPSWDPLIVHIADRRMLHTTCALVSFRSEAVESASSSPSNPAEALMDAFWPGPLTLLLPRTPTIPDAVTAGRPLVGVRIPSHPVALALIRAAGVPVAAPSANTFGYTSPTSAAHVLADLDGRVDAVLDGGETQVGLESTVLELTAQGTAIVYRPGAVTTAMIEGVLGAGRVHLYASSSEPSQAPRSLPSPGVGIRHYAPRARILLVPGSPNHSPDALLEPALTVLATGSPVGVMLPDGWAAPPRTSAFAWGSWDDPNMLAHRLFTGLRQLDDQSVATIVCPVPSGAGVADAIRDRLYKAAR